MALLKNATSLREIHLFGTTASPEALQSLQEALPSAELMVRRGAKLGVQGQPGQTGGALILRVMENEAAHKAGLHRDDVITGFNGAKIDNFEELTSRIAELTGGDKARLEVQRPVRQLDGGEDVQVLQIDVEFGAWR